MSTKKGEMLLKLAGFETKANATKVAKKLMELTAETEIRDLSKPAKVEKTPVKKTSSAKKPAKKAAQKSEK